MNGDGIDDLLLGNKAMTSRVYRLKNKDIELTPNFDLTNGGSTTMQFVLNGRIAEVQVVFQKSGNSVPDIVQQMQVQLENSDIAGLVYVEKTASDTIRIGVVNGINSTLNVLADSPVFAMQTAGLASTNYEIAANLPIPDAYTASNPGVSTVSSNMYIDNLGTIKEIRIQVAIKHTWDSDLTATLISPDGTRVRLFSGVGGSGDNIGFFDGNGNATRGVQLSDGAATPIEDGIAPFTAFSAYKPAQALSAFLGKPTYGIWKLEVTDSAGGDVGTLSRWKLFVDYVGTGSDFEKASQQLYDSISLPASPLLPSLPDIPKQRDPNLQGSPGRSERFAINITSFGAESARPFALQDLNKDGLDDFALMGSDPSSSGGLGWKTSIYYGRYDGSWPAQADETITGSSPLVTTSGDYDHDGTMDLAVTTADNGSDALFIFHSVAEKLLAGSTHTLNEADVVIPYTDDWQSTRWLGSADLNGDRYDDLLVSSSLAVNQLDSAQAGQIYVAYGLPKRIDLPTSNIFDLENFSVPGSGSFVVDKETGRPIEFSEAGNPFSLTTLNDEKWFRFSTLGDGLLGDAIRLNTKPFSSPLVKADLIDRNGNVLATNKTVVDMRAFTAGTYYLRVHDFIGEFTITLDAPSRGQYAGSSTLPDRDLIVGGDGDDRLYGNNDIDRIFGGSGADLISAEPIEIRDSTPGDSTSLTLLDERISSDVPLVFDPKVKLSASAILLTEGFDSFVVSGANRLVDPALNWSDTVPRALLSSSTPSTALFSYGGTSLDFSQLKSVNFDLSKYQNVQLSYNYKLDYSGSQSGHDLIVEYRNNSGVWIELDRQVSNVPAMSAYAFTTVEVPSSALHDAFEFRFRIPSISGVGRWWVDSIQLQGFGYGTAVANALGNPVTVARNPGKEVVVPSDGNYTKLVDRELAPTAILDFGSKVTITGVAIYTGYANADDADYLFLDDENNNIGWWTISGTTGSGNAGVDSYWLSFKEPVTTTKLNLWAFASDSDVSFREIQVFANGPTGRYDLGPSAGHLTITDATNLVLAGHQIEQGSNTSSNPDVTKGEAGTIVRYTATGISSVPGNTAYDISHLSDGDINSFPQYRERQVIHGTITASDLGSIASLDASGQQVTTIAGFDGLINVQSLNLSGNLLSSLDPNVLQSSSSLISLDLSNNPLLKDISPLASLSRLKYLYLDGTAAIPQADLNEIEPNDSPTTSQVIENAWSIASNPNVEQSTGLPHTSIHSTSSSSFDYYSFSGTAGSRVLIDIDNNNFDSFLQLIQGTTVIACNDDSQSSCSGGLTWAQADPGDGPSTIDSFIDFTLPATDGYIIKVGKYDSSAPAVPKILDTADAYTLNVSVANHDYAIDPVPTLKKLEDLQFLSLAVRHLAPAGQNLVGKEGTPVSLTVQLYSGNTDDWSVRDPLGNLVVSGDGATINFTPEDPGVYTITHTETGSFPFFSQNVAPVISGTPQTVNMNEGESKTVDQLLDAAGLTIVDPGSTPERQVTVTDSNGVVTDLTTGSLTMNNDVIKLDPAILDQASDVTVSFWLRTTSSGYQDVLSADTVNSNSFFNIVALGGTKIVIYGDIAKQFDAPTPFNDDAWHHFVVIRNDTADTLSVYLDGAQLGNAQSKTLGTLHVTGLIAGQEHTANGVFQNSLALQGKLDDLAIWRRVLTPVQITQIYSDGIVGTEADLAAYYPLNELGGDIAHDRSPNARDGVISSVDTTTSVAWSKDTGLASGALTLSNDIIDLDNAILNGATAVTFSFWMKTDANTSFMTLLGSTATSNSLSISTANNNDLIVFFGNSVYQANSGATLNDNAWHHIAIVRDTSANQWRFYVGGVLIQSVANSPTESAIILQLTDLFLGDSVATGSTEFFEGSVDDFAILRRALTTPEIVKIAADGILGNEPNLAVYYPFDEQYGNIAYDLSSNGRNAVIRSIDTLTPITWSSSGIHGQKVFHPLNEGDYTLTVVVHDAQGASDRAEAMIHVANVAPTSVLSQLTAGNLLAGQSVQFNALQSTDPGVNDKLTYFWEVSFNGESAGFVSSESNFEFTPTFAGSYVVKLTVTDSFGVATATMSTVSVKPSIAVVANQTGNEGDVFVFDASSVSPKAQNATRTYAWSAAGSVGNDATFAFSAPDNGVYPVTLTITDTIDGTAYSTTRVLSTVTTGNLAPTIAFGATTFGKEGSQVTLAPVIHDVGSADTLTYLWTIVDGNSNPVTLDTAANLATVSLTPQDNGTYSATLTVTDKDGSSTSSSTTIVVANVAPVVNAGLGQSFKEGEDIFEANKVVFEGSFTDAGLSDGDFTYVWDFGDGSQSTPATIAAGGNLPTTDHLYADSGKYTATLTVKDKDQAIGTSTVLISIENKAPAIFSFVVPSSAQEDRSVMVTGTFGDFNGLLWSSIDVERMRAQIDFGDGTILPVAIEDWVRGGVSAFYRFTSQHVFANPGTYYVQLTVRDDDGGVTKSAFRTISISDTTPPTVTAEAISPTLTNTPVDEIVIHFSEEVTGIDLSDFGLRYNGGFVDLNASAAVVTDNGNNQWTISNLASLNTLDGDYEFFLSAGTSNIRDTKGYSLLLANDLHVTWSLDLTAPTVTVNSVSSINNSPRLTGTVNDRSASIAVTVDGNTYTAESMQDGTWRIAPGVIAPLNVGVYSVAVTATDTLGNARTDITNNELIVLEAPVPSALGTDVLITLAQGQAHNIVVRKGGDNLEVVDQNGPTVLSSTLLATTHSLKIMGSDTDSDTILIDFAGGYFRLPQGIEVFGGSGVGDSLTVTGTGNTQAIYSMAVSPVGQTQVTVFDVSGSNTIRYSDYEAMTFDGMLSFASTSMLNVGSSSLTIGSITPVDLSGLTMIGGGTLTSTSTIVLGAAESLIGSGIINAPFAGETGSLIKALGAMTIGSAASPIGFATRGEVQVGTNTLTLLDSNQAVLGSLTTLGTTGVATGSLLSANGLLVDYGSNVAGWGTLQSPNDPNQLVMHNGAISGNSLTEQITLAGFVKGVGTLDNVNISGTYSPGFSPAVVYNGSVSYGSTGTTLIEVGGTSAGSSGYDQLNHSGSVIIGGGLDIQIINGFVPSYGQVFDVMTWEGTSSGSFGGIVGTRISNSLAVIPRYTNNSVELVTTGPGDANLDGRVSIADFSAMQNGFGKSGQWQQGDFNLDGNISIADFAILQNAFGATYFTSGSTAANGAGQAEGEGQPAREVAPPVVEAAVPYFKSVDHYFGQLAPDTASPQSSTNPPISAFLSKEQTVTPRPLVAGSTPMTEPVQLSVRKSADKVDSVQSALPNIEELVDLIT